MSGEITIGGISVGLDLKISAEQIASWPPEVTRAFFDGVAVLISAQQAGANLAAAVEKRGELERLIMEVRLKMREPVAVDPPSV